MRGKARSWRRSSVVVLVVLLAVLVFAASGVLRSQSAPELARTAASGFARALQGGDTPVSKVTAGVAEKGKPAKVHVRSKPIELHLTKAHGAVFDVRTLKSHVVKLERPEHAAPGEVEQPGAIESSPSHGLPATISPSAIAAVNAPAPAPNANFAGLDFANWGQGHPPDTNGDVGPNYYIQTINVSLGIYDKTSGNRVAAFTSTRS
jgi:hypothetical protein